MNSKQHPFRAFITHEPFELITIDISIQTSPKEAINIFQLWQTILVNLHKHFQPKTTLGELLLIYSEAVVRRCSIKKVFLEISQNSLENTYSRVSFLKSCRPLVAAASLLFNNIFLIADFQNLFYITMERNSTIQYLNVYLKFTDVKPFRITQYYPMEIDCVKE